MNSELFDDPIVAEVRQARAILAARFNNDFDAMIADARAREGSSGQQVVSLPPKRILRKQRDDSNVAEEFVK